MLQNLQLSPNLQILICFLIQILLEKTERQIEPKTYRLIYRLKDWILKHNNESSTNFVNFRCSQDLTNKMPTYNLISLINLASIFSIVDLK